MAGELHIRFEAQSYDLTFNDLDLGDLSTDAQIREAVARHLDAPPGKLAQYQIDRHEGDITLRPQAVFG